MVPTSPALTAEVAVALKAVPHTGAPARPPAPSLPEQALAYDLALGALGLDADWHAPWPRRRYALALTLAYALLVEIRGLDLSEAARTLGGSEPAVAARHLRAHRALLTEEGPLRGAYDRAWRRAAEGYASAVARSRS